MESREGRSLLLGSDGRLMPPYLLLGTVNYGLSIVLGLGATIGVCIVARCPTIGCIIKNSNNSVSRL